MIITKWRNSKGQFSKFDSKLKLSKEIYRSVKGSKYKRIARNELKTNASSGGTTGVRCTYNGKRVAFKVGQFIDKGYVYINGVVVFRLKSESVITKEIIKIIKDYLMHIKRGNKKPLSRNDLAREIYSDYEDDDNGDDDGNYKDQAGRPTETTIL